MSRTADQVTAIEAREFARVEDLMRAPNSIFVFGSNERGAHGGGAALEAVEIHGASWGIGEGLAGRSYAIPTKDLHLRSLPLEAVARYVRRFIDVARVRPDLTFAVTRVGCGLAGFTDAEIAPLFADAPENCALPEGWRA